MAALMGFMIDIVSPILQAAPVKAAINVLVVLFMIALTETLVCVALAMRFQIRELSSYKTCFCAQNSISSPREAVTWQESKQNWFLWLSVVLGSCHIKYMPLVEKQSATNIGRGIANAFLFAILYLLALLHIAFLIASFFERIYRFFLGFFGLALFWGLANLKLSLSYHLNGYKICINSDVADSIHTNDILYRKPTIIIMLCSPNNCADSTQKDNLNHFTASLKSILPQQTHIRFKTLVYYPDGERGLKADLPLTERFLHTTFKTISVKSKEANE